VPLDPDACWGAFAARDGRFDGRFVAAVTSTGIYCRPGCPARLPRRSNVRFYAHAAAAQADGFRPCLRCRPDASPGSAAWSGASASVSRALRLISAGALDGAGVEELAARLGQTGRHLTRLFQAHLGTTPGAVARLRRAHFARQLLEQTRLPIAEVAFAAGFGSIRRFNEAMRAAFHDTPGALRARAVAPAGGPLALALPYRPPLEWEALLGFLSERAIPGVEVVEGGTYRRTHLAGGVATAVSVAAVPGAPRLSLEVSPPAPGALLDVVARARRLFDLDADPAAIAAALGRDAVLAASLDSRPGLRVPGAWDGFELAVRAILGQQISVRAASTLAGRLVALCGRRLDAPAGGLTHLFPTADAVAALDPARLGLPRARGEALVGLARAVAQGDVELGPGASLDATVAALRTLPGVGPWTAGYLAMRAAGEPDAFPAGDLGIRKALGAPGAPVSERDAERLAAPWRPWRAYAAMHLWASLPAPGAREDGVRRPPAAMAAAT
jgi:AraC family transcriptional regulator, regulatory protein of adaptative response / DNA-3-methyladenine glycosylase II